MAADRRHVNLCQVSNAPGDQRMLPGSDATRRRRLRPFRHTRREAYENPARES